MRPEALEAVSLSFGSRYGWGSIQLDVLRTLGPLGWAGLRERQPAGRYSSRRVGSNPIDLGVLVF